MITYGEGDKGKYHGTKEPYLAHMDGYLKGNLDLYKKMVRNKRDLVFVGTGREGEGKTVLVSSILKYLDPSFNLDRCYLDGEEFTKAIIAAKEPFKAYMYDEGQEFTSRSAMSKFNKMLVQVLSKCRAKQLYIGICIPSFFELDKYPAIHRSSFLVQVYSTKGIRGRFLFWNWDKKKMLYMLGKKAYDYNVVKSNFMGVFNYRSFPFHQAEYDEKKFESMDNISFDDYDKSSRWKCQRDELIKHLHNVFGVKQVDISQIIGKSGQPLNIRGVSHVIKDSD